MKSYPFNVYGAHKDTDVGGTPFDRRSSDRIVRDEVAFSPAKDPNASVLEAIKALEKRELEPVE